MTNDEIRELIQIFSESGVAEMEVKRGENSLRLRRSFGLAHAAEVFVPSASPSAASMAHPPLSAPGATLSAPAVPAASEPASGASPADYVVKSPIVGTFFESAKPGEPPFVKEGDTVEPGHVLCIIESMKLMNEIESEVAGIITARLIENGRPVEYGEPLFTIRKR